MAIFTHFCKHNVGTTNEITDGYFCRICANYDFDDFHGCGQSKRNQFISNNFVEMFV